MISINENIPHTMTRAGLEFLGELAKTVPPGGTIVEIGPLFGSSTWVLSKNAHPTVKVVSIDTWEMQPWIEKLHAKFPGCEPFSIEAFKHYTSDCPNVIPVQGWSPDVVKDYPFGKIDMVFDDATHGDPGFSKNMEFFSPLLRDGAILCGDDYASGWPDIVRVVDKIGMEWGQEPQICGRVWALEKPDSTGSASILNTITETTEAPHLFLSTKLASGKVSESAPRCWSGALHKRESISEVTLQSATKDLPEIEFRLVGSDYQSTDWVAAGTTLAVPGDNLIGFQARLSSNSSGYKLGYQGCQVNKVNGKTGNTKLVHADAALIADPDCYFSALRCILQR